LSTLQAQFQKWDLFHIDQTAFNRNPVSKSSSKAETTDSWTWTLHLIPRWSKLPDPKKRETRWRKWRWLSSTKLHQSSINQTLSISKNFQNYRITPTAEGTLQSTTWSSQILQRLLFIKRAFIIRGIYQILSTMTNSMISFWALILNSAQLISTASKVNQATKLKGQDLKIYFTVVVQLLSLAPTVPSSQDIMGIINTLSLQTSILEESFPWEASLRMPTNSSRKNQRKTTTLITQIS